MTDRPIDLDTWRTKEGKLEIDMRRKAVTTHASPDEEADSVSAQIDAATLAEPARTWIEATKEVRFLLELYAATPEAEDPRLHKLIQRALSDLARLTKREENK
ncbi:hypothetical protein GGD81_004688 [Rhodobium orientis]|uniref:Uncharacterized protein n=1 Tax=Rhodobium orientis TaxID=34017 RepID=A0A327JNH2_9HYPH|nr:hypothetical protein [Rhodobium orientis]MBB4305607.1 hypothetical protein [Rhodobium orientis]MBK5950869.1 hypothetical protein [Rhodobium orientis]RAI24968.1 hypothetical protein CH339_20245 [Rhodobium orientis]